MVRDANELNIHISERMHFSGRMKKIEVSGQKVK